MYLLFPESKQQPEFQLSQSPPTLWDTLPGDIRSTEYVITFRRHLKPVLFSLTYPPQHLSALFHLLINFATAFDYENAEFTGFVAQLPSDSEDISDIFIIIIISIITLILQDPFRETDL